MRVKLRRIELGLTQEELSQKVNIARARIVEVEKGYYENLRLREMKKIAEVLKTTIYHLFLGGGGVDDFK
ncbi:MAG: helix-turn-helix transcriptional regulator [Clostridium celatum]|nr:helix-turn-helix transcriptional regulator [Clostridium celatum]